MSTLTIEHAGYVYVIKSGPLYKIGRTKNLLRRKRQFQTGNSSYVEFLYYRFFKDAVKAEKTLHTIFSALRRNGEWFELDTNNRRLLDKIFGAELLSNEERIRLERLGIV